MVDHKSSDKVKILVTHVYSSKNKGDAALLSVLLADIRRGFNNAQVTVFTLDEFKKDSLMSDVDIEYSLMTLARDKYKNIFAKLFYSLFLVVYTTVWSVLYRFLNIDINLNKTIHDKLVIFKNTDFVITVGGGYIRGNKGINGSMVLFFILHSIFISIILKKTTIGYPQSIGPFADKFQKSMANLVIKRMSAVIARETISYEYLRKIGLKNAYLVPDSGFLLNYGSEVIKPENSPKIVGITVRKWLTENEQNIYEKNIALLCDYIIEKYGFKIMFIPQVTVENHNDDDRLCSNDVYEKMKNKNGVSVSNTDYDYQEIKKVYSSLDFLIGTRFHSVIFALTSLVPSIAIQYEHKTIGIMTDLGLEKWVIDIDKTEIEKLKKMFDDLVFEHDEYVNELKTKLPSYVDKAKEAINIVKGIVYEEDKNR